MPPRANKTPTTAGKTPTTAGKAPAATDNELISQDPDAVLAALERVIGSSARAFARPFAPAIASMSIALRKLQDDALTEDQEVSVRVYMPFNADNNGASYRRVEAEFYNLQPEEKEQFVRLVDGVRAERDDDGGLERDEQNRAKRDNHKGEAAKLKELRKIAGDQDIKLAQAQAHIAELKRVVKQRDDEREDDEKKTSKLENLQKLLDEANVELFKEQARNAELKEELAMYRRDPKKHPLASLKKRDDEDDAVAEETGEKGADDAEDDAPTFDHAGDHAPSVADAKVTKKPVSGAPSKKPRPSMPSFTFAPKTTRSNSTATDLPKTSKKPDRMDRMEGGSGTYGKGYERQYGPPWGINDNDPEKTWRDNRRKSRQLEAKSASDQQTPESAAAGTSAAHESTGTPSGQAIAGGPGRKQSKVSTKASKSMNNDQGSEADVGSDEDFEEPRKYKPEKKRKSETPDGEDQPTTSKKPRNMKSLQPVEKESNDEDKHVRAARGLTSSSRTKAKPSHTKQNAKHKVVRTDSAESEGGMSDPISISSGEETDTDTDDED